MNMNKRVAKYLAQTGRLTKKQLQRIRHKYNKENETDMRGTK